MLLNAPSCMSIKLVHVLCQAYFQYWCLIAERMKIEDMPKTLEDLRAWSDVSFVIVFVMMVSLMRYQAYEETYMVPSNSSHILGDRTITHLLRSVPTALGIHAFIQEAVYSMLEDRVRVAMMCVL